MYQLNPITERVSKLREKYRETKPEICIARYKLVTEFYKAHPELEGILKRALNFKNLCENIPVRIDDDEIIVGGQSGKYRATAIYPENSATWIKEEIETRLVSTRDIDPYIISEEDRSYVLETIDFWMTECLSGKIMNFMPEYLTKYAMNGVTMYGLFGNSGQQCGSPVGHFTGNHWTATSIGFGAIKAEAEAKLRELEENGIFGESIDQYNFYRAVSIVCEGMITLTKRYAKLAEEKAAAEKNPRRKKELEKMADALNWCMEKPCRTFHEALQTLYMYQNCMCLDATMHGISYGRVDQYLGSFYDADIAAGRITHEEAQELLDLFYLKVAEMNKLWSYGATKSGPGYTSGQLMTLGGVDKYGNDASNAVTYMMLQSAGRLVLHDPPQALRIHKNTPAKLWEAAIETTKISGGVPTFENDDVIIPSLMARGRLPLESARNYTLIGCVEPSGCGDEWPACGGSGTESYMNLANALLLGINDGYYNAPFFGGKNPENRGGLATGYLYEMENFNQVLDAVRAQIEFFVKLHANCTNAFEYLARQILPLPVVSSTITGCMETGKDVMFGGARYNSTGISGVGIGNVADSLAMIKHLCFDAKKCTTRELYDALMNNWEGCEELQRYIKNEAPHYGNGIKDVDKWAGWASDVFANAVNACTGPRGKFSAGLYPVTTNVIFGQMTSATPDGRASGTPLADGISPVQQMDLNGPTATLVSVSNIDQVKYPNGTLLNMKFHPSSLQGEEGVTKLSNLIQAYFGMGGMEMQINVVSAETLKNAQKKPEEYKNLVVRVAGFSTYFIELHVDSQNDLISRTELAM
jgi:pyruvate formate-lyase/glycerol dehydratase family glycyl radical enzyme